MELVRALDERYVWVDALCIVQDDNDSKMQDIHNMGALYANATFTIVAADGDASTGLNVLRQKVLEGPSFYFNKFTFIGAPYEYAHSKRSRLY